MHFERWDATAAVTYDRKLLDELASLRFLETQAPRSHHTGEAPVPATGE